ncbi:hypothetical protein AVEN_42051-1 [Araneus ventricosus]|uniref:Uncharacterized protein n=1 Tax=Araneus ventricosus TaxID=182803 RepID=A0A4Y2GFU5_ARAVE|nr:hypothetical protein AVEN_42051-1 [Araneus ventricosus]
MSFANRSLASFNVVVRGHRGFEIADMKISNKVLRGSAGAADRFSKKGHDETRSCAAKLEPVIVTKMQYWDHTDWGCPLQIGDDRWSKRPH